MAAPPEGLPDVFRAAYDADVDPAAEHEAGRRRERRRRTRSRVATVVLFAIFAVGAWYVWLGPGSAPRTTRDASSETTCTPRACRIVVRDATTYVGEPWSSKGVTHTRNGSRTETTSDDARWWVGEIDAGSVTVSPEYGDPATRVPAGSTFTTETGDVVRVESADGATAVFTFPR